MKHIYCSGPLFCPEEIAGMAAVAQAIEEAGYGTYLPHRDGVERLVLGLTNSPVNIDLFGSRDRIDRAIFALDVYQIVERCDCLVFNMNGRVPDEGASVEAGIAFAAGRPVVLYKNDRRTAFKGRDNSMLYGLSPLPPVNEIKQLPATVRKALAHCAGHRPYDRLSMPDGLRKISGYGGKVWKVMDSIPKDRRRQDDAALVRLILETAPLD